MFKQKRGLSEVIVTSLIIILGIAAVLIVWGFVSSTLEKAGDNLDLSSSCLNMQVKPLNCILDAGAPANVPPIPPTAKVNVQLLNSGGNQISAIKAIVTSSDGSKKIAENSLIPNELGTVEVILESVTEGYATASVTILSESGSSFTCPESLEKVTCQ